MISYADSSFLVSLYLPDINSSVAAAELRNKAPRLVITSFSLFEFTNAVLAWRFRGEASVQEAERVLAQFRGDYNSGVFEAAGFPDGVWERACVLAEAYTPRLGARALDILHVAIAKELGSTFFYTFDGRQAKLARTAGMRIRPTLHQ